MVRSAFRAEELADISECEWERGVSREERRRRGEEADTAKCCEGQQNLSGYPGIYTWPGFALISKRAEAVAGLDSRHHTEARGG